VKTLVAHILSCPETYPVNPNYSRERGTCLAMLSMVEVR
jgi:hypothetical protein